MCFWVEGGFGMRPWFGSGVGGYTILRELLEYVYIISYLTSYNLISDVVFDVDVQLRFLLNQEMGFLPGFFMLSNSNSSLVRNVHIISEQVGLQCKWIFPKSKVAASAITFTVKSPFTNPKISSCRDFTVPTWCIFLLTTK